MTDRILEGLKLLANQAVSGSEYATDEHVAMHAIDEIKSLRRINARLISDMAHINELLGGDGTERAPTLLSKRIGGFENIWTTDPPTVSGVYWHWSGNQDDAPIPLNVLWSGSANACFVSAGQYGIEQAVFCDKHGGLWRRAIEPDTDVYQS